MSLCHNMAIYIDLWNCFYQSLSYYISCTGISLQLSGLRHLWTTDPTFRSAGDFVKSYWNNFLKVKFFYKKTIFSAYWTSIFIYFTSSFIIKLFCFDLRDFKLVPKWFKSPLLFIFKSWQTVSYGPYLMTLGYTCQFGLNNYIYELKQTNLIRANSCIKKMHK